MEGSRLIITLTVAIIVSASLASSDTTADMIDSASGTGLLIDKNHILTASHVIDDADDILVEFSNDAPIKATVCLKNAEEDWAVLKLDVECEALPVSCATEMQLGDKVYTLGFPSTSLLGRSIKYTDGSVSSLTGMMDNPDTFQFSAPIQPGNSGGPIFDKDGQVVGIVLSCLDPSRFFQKTGGALPQAVNFGLKIQNVISQINGISVAQKEGRTVSQNHNATCSIRTKQKLSINRLSTCKQNGSAQSKVDDGGIGSTTFDYSKVSQRYRQLAHYLEDISNGLCKALDGEPIDASTVSGVSMLEANVEKANKYLIIEGLSLFLYKATEYPKSTIDDNTLNLYSKAKSAIWDIKKKNGQGNVNWADQTFWGLKLRSKIRLYQDNEEDKRAVYIDGVKSEVVRLSRDSDEVLLCGREDWPVFEITCIGAKQFRWSSEFKLITSVDDILIGIKWASPFFINVKPQPEDLITLFESKYKIHFERNCPSHSEFIYNKANVLNSRKSIDWRIKKPYSYEDKDVIIYISSVDEAVLVLDSRYEEIIKKDKIKLEQRRLNAAREIFGSESL